MEKLEKIEDDLLYQVDSEKIPPEDIFAFNELRSCADLYRMHKSGRLEIQPDYQRNIVWTESDQTRFIDSLMKQLPIPSMCFSLDNKIQKWKIIDGLQRMYTIIRFLSEDEWILSKISDINQNIAGKKASEIKTKYPELYSLVENFTLPITILRCDYTKKDHEEYIFMIFHRLNAGGLKLSNQEIRNAIYSGSLNDFLKECDKNQKWKELFGAKNNKRDRFKKVELILRFFSFIDNHNNYKGRLASFLNDYMFENRYLAKQEIEKKKEIFDATIELIYYKISNKESFPKISNVVMEALMFGVAKNIKILKEQNKKTVKGYYNKLRQSTPFLEENIREGISSKVKVIERLNTAQKKFSGEK
ncbi:MAG: DUF262 domain-containing protein [bacterium]|nr:DUF262 domain-containing protein [bacterium]